MLVYTGKVHGTRETNYDGKTTYYMQLTSEQPASGNPFGDEFKLPPGFTDVKAIPKDSKIQIRVRLFAGNNKAGNAQLYMSVVPHPDGSVYQEVQDDYS